MTVSRAHSPMNWQLINWLYLLSKNNVLLNKGWFILKFCKEIFSNEIFQVIKTTTYTSILIMMIIIGIIFIIIYIVVNNTSEIYFMKVFTILFFFFVPPQAAHVCLPTD